ncbi:MAG: hypothetical protein ACREAA_17070 [Candidatus Polarisedimenticolia bacterium]
MTHLAEDALIDLLHGLLPAGEAESMLGHMRSCSACEERFRMAARDNERARAVGAPLMRPANGASRRRWKVAGVAAGILMGALLAVLLRDRPAVEPYWLPVEEDQVSLRSLDTDEPPRELLSALDAYKERDARRALEWLERAPVSSSYRGVRDVYLASALVNDGRNAEAGRVLRGLGLETMPQPWRSRARWLLYLVMKEDNDPGAPALLNQLADDPDVVGEWARRELRSAGLSGAPPAE